MEKGELMNRQPVSSSVIRSVGYEAETRTLELEFCSGQIYHYSDVPEMKYQDLMQADSKGSYFNKCIRYLYPTKRIG